MSAGQRDRPRRMVVVLAVAALVIGIDQATKTWAEHRVNGRSIEVGWTLRLRLTLNPGIAFSLGRGSTPVVTVVATVILVVVGVVAWRSSGRLMAVALGLIIGGAAGNLLDRLLRHHGGQVIDFIDLRWWPVFNVADAAVSCGVVLAIVANLLSEAKAGREGAAPPSS